MQTCKLFGLKIHNVTLSDSLLAIDGFIKDGGSHLIVTLGVEMVMRAEKDREFFDIVNEASLVVPDSTGILWGCKKFGHPLKQRVPGIDILQASAEKADQLGWKVFFLGAKPGVAETAALRMKEKYPGFNVVGAHHGYFKDDDEVIEKIRSSGAQIIFAALGSPFQEKWFVKNREKLSPMVSVGVGGSLDVMSGMVKRAPVIFQKTGLEWFHRLVTQPSRAGRMAALPLFAIKVLLSKGDSL